MDCDAEAFSFRSHFDAVAQPKIRVPRVGNQLVGARATLSLCEFRHRVPLLRRGQQPHFAIGGNALAVQDHFDAAELLVAKNVMKLVLIHEDAQSLSIEIPELVDVQVGSQ
jgi:hypothetical protein